LGQPVHQDCSWRNPRWLVGNHDGSVVHSTAYLQGPRCHLWLTTHSYLLPDAAPLGSEGDPVFSPLLGTLCKCVGFPFPRGRGISLVAAGMGTGCECIVTPHRTSSCLEGHRPSSSSSPRGSPSLRRTWFRGNVSHRWSFRSLARPGCSVDRRWPGQSRAG